MNTALLKKHIGVYKKNLAKDPEKHINDLTERKERIAYYQSWTKDRIPSRIGKGDGFIFPDLLSPTQCRQAQSKVCNGNLQRCWHE